MVCNLEQGKWGFVHLSIYVMEIEWEATNKMAEFSRFGVVPPPQHALLTLSSSDKGDCAVFGWFYRSGRALFKTKKKGFIYLYFFLFNTVRNISV